MKKAIMILALIALISAAAFAFLANSGFFTIVESDSMSPALARGDIAYAAAETEYNIGDIIIFSYDNETYIHRIIFAKDGKYETKGDASLNLDHWKIEKENIAGRMKFKIPLIGNIFLWIKGR